MSVTARTRRPLVGLIALVGLVGLVGLTSCRGDVTVMEVWAIDDGRGLEVILDTCNADVSVTVEEYDDRVVVHAENHDRRLFFAGSDDCQDLVRVELGTPLGSRRVTNSSGEEFVVVPR
jgi:hypothetical protein